MTRKNFNLFLTEVIEKENESRLRWFEKHYEKVFGAKPAELVPSKAKVLHDEIARRRLEQQRAKEHHPQIKTAPIMLKPNMEIQILPLMRPVPQQEIELLLDGSAAYLLQRYQHSPSDRFYRAEASSWQYGWEAEKRALGTSDSKQFGHRNIINQTFPRRNGVHPELPYVRPPATFNFDYPFL